MRWTDLPADREPADAGAGALSRGEWDDLRRRLERLPAGHPSHPDAEGEARVGEALASEDSGSPEAPEAPDPRNGRDRGPEREARDRNAGEGGRDRPGTHGDLGGLGRREPYRPWFTAGESPEPWFAADPG
jgi:hypothetical protein